MDLTNRNAIFFCFRSDLPVKAGIIDQNDHVGTLFTEKTVCLPDELHKTTPYDLYLIFNEALKYDDFRTMISQVAYTTSINDANGNIKDVSVESTNLFFKGAFEVPGTLNIIGGKTGTTAAAGSCLVMYAKDSSTNKEYITVVLKAPDRDTSYQDTLLLLTL